MVVRGFSSLEAVSMLRNIEMRLCNQAIPYLHSPGPNSILQDDSVCPHRAQFTRNLQNLGGEWVDWPTCSPDHNHIEHLRDQFGCDVCARVTNAG